MTARFGRNKRRAAREAVLSAQAEAEVLKSKLRTAENRIADAEKRGADAVLNNREAIQAAQQHITRELAWKLSDELFPYAKRLFEADSQHRTPLRFDASMPMDATFEVMRVRGSVRLDFNVAVPRW